MSDQPTTESGIGNYEPRADSTLQRRQWLRVIREDSEIYNEFNVLPGRSVKESLIAREYRIAHRFIEVEFDRRYHSAMERSPDHLIVTSMQIQTQKLVYVYLCHEFGIPYDPEGPERLKIWVNRFSVSLLRLIRQTERLTQKMDVLEIEKIDDGAYRVTLSTHVDNIATIDAVATVYTI